MITNTSWLGSVRAEGGSRPGETITRVVTIAPEWAELALEDTRWSHGQRGGNFWLALPGASLQLQRVAGDGTTRRFTGVLASDRGWHRLAVEVELAEWSREKSQLSLRLLDGTRRPGWGRWYLRSGCAFVDLLAATVGSSSWNQTRLDSVGDTVPAR